MAHWTEPCLSGIISPMTNPAVSRLLIVVNDAGFFLSHRLPIADAARKAGYEVHIATGPGPAVCNVVAVGFPHHLLPLSRSGVGPLAEGRLLIG